MPNVRLWLSGIARRWFGPASAPTASPREVELMHLALAQARLAAEMGEVPVGAVVYHLHSGAVIASAHNRRERDCNPAGHAELLAISAAASTLGDWRLNECGLAVTLEPCCMCAGAIVQARLGRVVFGAFDPKAGFAGSLGNLLTDTRLNHRVRPLGGVLEHECAELLRAFFKARRTRGGKVNQRQSPTT
jgi:tRNA(adenine34) deaminase